MPTFTYVYILTSISHPNRPYIGLTEDLATRLAAHSSGRSPHTAKYRPWRIRAAVALPDRKRALELESYLKSRSGRAFISKRL